MRNSLFSRNRIYLNLCIHKYAILPRIIYATAWQFFFFIYYSYLLIYIFECYQDGLYFPRYENGIESNFWILFSKNSIELTKISKTSNFPSTSHFLRKNFVLPDTCSSSYLRPNSSRRDSLPCSKHSSRS